MSRGAPALVWVERRVETPEDGVQRPRADHLAGLAAARAALQEVGSRTTDLAPAEGRRPVFPPGFLGSISHDRGIAAAAVVPVDDGATAIGIDLHHVQPVETAFAAFVATDPELRAATRAAGEGGAHVLFALKEALFKAVSSSSGAWLEFDDIELRVRGDGSALLRRPRLPGTVLRWSREGALVRALAMRTDGRVARLAPFHSAISQRISETTA